MKNEENPKQYDLEARTEEFARRVRKLVREMRPTALDIDDVRQLIRSSGSVGANYIEANESLGKKDFLCHLKISRKESKESRYWLRLLVTVGREYINSERLALIQEATELMSIFGAIFRKSE